MTFKERFQALRTLPPFFKQIWQTSPMLALINAGLRVAKSGIPLAMLYVGKLIIDEVIRLHQLEGTGDREWVLWLIGTELGLAILSDLLGRGISLSESLLGDLFANWSSVRIMEHAAALDLDQFEDAEFYDKLERARRQTNRRTILMGQVLGQIQDLVSMLFLVGGILAFAPWLLVILVITVIPAFLGETHFNEQTYSLVRNWTPERRELDYLRYTGASDETAKEIKMFGLSDFIIQRFKFLSDKFYDENKSLAVKRAGWGSFFAALGTLGYYGAYVFIVYRTVSGELTVGDLTFLAGSFANLRALLAGILTKFSSVADGAMYLQDYYDFFQIQPKIKKPESSRTFPRPIREGFTFEKVSFKYENSEKWAIRELSFHLPVGEKLALVGENGAGKTTLVKLLSRMYDPTEGRILLDGIDLREFDPEELRQNTGVIFQDFVKFQMTAATNIAVGQINSKEDFPRIQQAAVLSLADTVIENLPEKYEQMIGRRFSNGVDLSGGQWQKVALGRAYMREAPLIILDEPTAALDARAEHEVFVRFSDLTQGKTAVLISHRFSTVRMADRILVLEDGKLLEIGSHEVLLQQKGRYAELFELQAAGYQ